MNAATFVAVLHALLPLATADSYAEAHRLTVESGKPMLVMVGAEWCGPCQRMKTEILPQVRRNGTLNNMAFALVDVDRQAELARRLTGGGPVPQLLMFHQTNDGWKRRKLIGGQSVQSVEKFINQGLAAERAKKTKVRPVSDR